MSKGEPPQFVPLGNRYVPDLAPEQVLAHLKEVMSLRRSIRDFSDRQVPREVIERLVAVAGTAPSGANRQPWRFVCVQDRELKRQIRLGAEEEERQFYESRAGEDWLKDLEPLGTDASKPFLEVAPWLVVLFKLTRTDDGGQVYYINESVGLAAGMFLMAAQMAGLATLTHTPSPMGFLGKILDRPSHERPFLLIPVGYPAEDCRVPKAALRKKSIQDIMVVR